MIFDSGTVVRNDQVDVDYVGDGVSDESDWEDTTEAYAAIPIFRDAPAHWNVPEAAFSGLISAAEASRSFADSYCVRFTNQAPTHECVCHSLAQGVEAAYQRMFGERGPRLWVSPLSIYSYANPGQRGGTTLNKAARLAAERGFLPSRDGDEGSRHQERLYPAVLHCTAGLDRLTGGPWVSVERMPGGHLEVRRHFRIHSLVNIRSLAQAVFALSHGYPVHYARDRHAIPATIIETRGRERWYGYRDSYRVMRYDSEAKFARSLSSAYVVYSVSYPSLGPFASLQRPL